MSIEQVENRKSSIWSLDLVDVSAQIVGIPFELHTLARCVTKIKTKADKQWAFVLSIFHMASSVSNTKTSAFAVGNRKDACAHTQTPIRDLIWFLASHWTVRIDANDAADRLVIVCDSIWIELICEHTETRRARESEQEKKRFFDHSRERISRLLFFCFILFSIIIEINWTRLLYELDQAYLAVVNWCAPRLIHALITTK